MKKIISTIVLSAVMVVMLSSCPVPEPKAPKAPKVPTPNQIIQIDNVE